jgi:hypothetical protein
VQPNSIEAPFSFMRSCNHHYGDRFTVTFDQKFGPLVFFSNPEALKVLLTGDDCELFDAAWLPAVEPARRVAAPQGGSDGVRGLHAPGASAARSPFRPAKRESLSRKNIMNNPSRK